MYETKEIATSMTNKVSLRQLALEDIDKIIYNKKEVLRYPYFSEETERAIYEWGLKRNPYRSEKFPIGYVLENNSTVIGAVVLVPARFKIGMEEAYACLENDLMVRPGFRFHGLKFLNMIWNTELFPLVISTTPNSNSFDIEKKLGAVGIGFTACRYIKIVDAVGMARKKNNFKLRHAISYTLSFVIGSMHHVSKKEHFKVEEISRFDERFDRLYEGIDYGVMHIRDSRHLNRRHVDFPAGKRKIYSITDHRKCLRGFVVIQLEKNTQNIGKANILDLITLKKDTAAMKGLLDIVVSFAKESGLQYVEIIPPSEAVKNVLAGTGFIKDRLPFPSCSFACHITDRPDVLKIVSDMNNWYISSADGDTSTYSGISWGK